MLTQIYGAVSTPSLVSDTGLLKLITSNTNKMACGLTTSSWAGWIQVKRGSNTGENYPHSLQPVGGNVGIGTTAAKVKLHIDTTVEDTYPVLGTAKGKLNLTNGGAYGLLAGIAVDGNSWLQAQRIDNNGFTRYSTPHTLAS